MLDYPHIPDGSTVEREIMMMSDEDFMELCLGTSEFMQFLIKEQVRRNSRIPVSHELLRKLNA